MAKIQAETASGLVETVAPQSKKLVLALEDAGIDILHRCGGNARCTTCRVEILEGQPEEMAEIERNRLAGEAELAKTLRGFGGGLLTWGLSNPARSGTVCPSLACHHLTRLHVCPAPGGGRTHPRLALADA